MIILPTFRSVTEGNPFGSRRSSSPEVAFHDLDRVSADAHGEAISVALALHVDTTLSSNLDALLGDVFEGRVLRIAMFGEIGCRRTVAGAAWRIFGNALAGRERPKPVGRFVRPALLGKRL